MALSNIRLRANSWKVYVEVTVHGHNYLFTLMYFILMAVTSLWSLLQTWRNSNKRTGGSFHQYV